MAKTGDFVFINNQVIRAYQAVSATFPGKSTRPLCIVVEDKKTQGIYWAVPVTSSSLDVYRQRAKKSPIKYRFYKLQGQDRCLNISQIFPILQSDITNVYQAKGKKVRLRSQDFRDLQQTVSKILQTKNMLMQVSNIQAPVLLQMAEKRLQMEQERSRANSLAQQPVKAEEKQMLPKMKLQAQLAEKKKNELHLHR